uniref:peptidylprolyl isomerase n=1 Tax=Chelonoidis abingdonii TaxID=106734 RepID=A0A8C0H0J0_CHEAB
IGPRTQQEPPKPSRVRALLLGALRPSPAHPVPRGSSREPWPGSLGLSAARKLLVREGQGEASRPQPGQEVTVKLLGVLEDGSLVEKDPKLTFILEQGDVIQALELSVQSMQLGEVSFLLTSFLYAYGHLGRDPDIPSDASLLYEVTLLQIQDSPDLGLLPPSVRISVSKQKRERGNFHFEREEYQRAMRSYLLALGILDSPGAVPPGPEEEEELQEHRVKCLNNCAAAQLKLQLFEEVLASCNAVLHIDPDNVKALYRKGKVQPKRGEDQAAMNILKRALQLEPTTKVKSRATAPLQGLIPKFFFECFLISIPVRCARTACTFVGDFLP